MQKWLCGESPGYQLYHAYLNFYGYVCNHGYLGIPSHPCKDDVTGAKLQTSNYGEHARIVRICILLHVRFPWQRDVGALSCNNGIVQHCCVSLATQQLKRRAYQQAAWLRTQQ
jgi:hypothetical protein